MVGCCLIALCYGSGKYEGIKESDREGYLSEKVEILSRFEISSVR